MKFPTVILYARNGTVIESRDGIDGMKKARETAKYLLTDDHAAVCESTHERMETMKVAIFEEGAPTGPNTICVWDRFHPQHAKWEGQDRIEEARELAIQSAIP